MARKKVTTKEVAQVEAPVESIVPDWVTDDFTVLAGRDGGEWFKVVGRAAYAVPAHSADDAEWLARQHEQDE